MAYYTLIASLPHLPPHFDVERPPISRPRLSERLKLLRETDAQILQQLTDFLAWDRQPMDRTDAQVVAEYERLGREIKHPVVLEIIEHRIDVRTIVGALRRRRDGAGPPVGVGQLVKQIQRNWTETQFGLARRFRWIEDFSERMAARDAVAAQRVLFQFTWDTWSQMASGFTFSFEAVLLYLARWAIVDRWTSRNARVGQARFEQLMAEVLGEHASIQF